MSTSLKVFCLLVSLCLVALLFGEVPSKASAHVKNGTTISIGDSWTGTQTDMNGDNSSSVSLMIIAPLPNQSDPIRANWIDESTILSGTEVSSAQAYQGALTDVISIWGSSPIDRYIVFTMTGTRFGAIVEGANGELKGIVKGLAAETWQNKFSLTKDSTAASQPIPQSVQNIQSYIQPMFAGYGALSKNGYSHVETTFTVPSIRCENWEISKVGIWTGLKGVEDAQLVQTGIVVNCILGEVSYNAFGEVTPNPPVFIDSKQYPVHVGNEITAAVSFNEGQYTMALANPAENWNIPPTNVYTKDLSLESRTVAACVVEAPTGGSVVPLLWGQIDSRFIYPLSNFGNVEMFCKVIDQQGDNSLLNFRFDMETGSPKTSTSPLALDERTFTVTWESPFGKVI